MSARLWMRCEADQAVGAGHWKRCWNLAMEFRALGEEAGFILPPGRPGLEKECGAAGFAVSVLPPELDIAEEAHAYPATARAVVLDMSNLRVLANPDRLPGLVNGLRERGIAVGLIDGLRAEGYARPEFPTVDVAVTPYVMDESEPARAAVHWLKGAEYAILGAEYRQPLPTSRGRKILVTMGGADPWNLTEQMLNHVWARRIETPAGLSWTFVAGPFFGEERTAALIASCDPTYMECLVTPEMIGQYRGCQATILGPGLSKYEAAACGLSPIILCPDDAQLELQMPFLNQKLALAAIPAWEKDLLPGRINAVLNLALTPSRCHGPIDGLGAQRVAQQLLRRLLPS